MAACKRISLLVLVVCLLIATSASAALADHTNEDECVLQGQVPPVEYCVPTPHQLYDRINELVCVRTGECTPVHEIPGDLLCEDPAHPEICRILP